MGSRQAIEKLENRVKYSQQGDACLSEARAHLARSELDKVMPSLLDPPTRAAAAITPIWQHVCIAACRHGGLTREGCVAGRRRIRCRRRR